MNRMSDSGRLVFNFSGMKVKILITGCILGVIFIFLSSYLASHYMNRIEKERLENLNQMVVVAGNSIKPHLEAYNRGDLDREEALEKISLQIESMVYNDHEGKNYFFMCYYNGFLAVNPFEPQNIMTNQWDFQDSNGVYVFRGLVETARNNVDGGYFTYQYMSPNSKAAEEKISFVLGIPELEFCIGTGKYLSDIRIEKNIFLIKIFGLNILMLLILYFLIRFILREIKEYNLSLLGEIELRRNSENELMDHRNNLEQILDGQLKKLKESEEKYYKLFENANDTILLIQNGKIVGNNEKALKMFGMSGAEIIGQTPAILSPEVQPDGGSSLKLANQKTDSALNNRPQFFEWKHMRADKTYFDAEVSLNRIDLGGEKTLQAIIRDITARKQAMEEKESSIAELKNAMENIKTLKGLLPICAKCKKIRDDKGYWSQIEGYIETHSDALFSHGMCPECEAVLYGDQEWYRKRAAERND